MPTTRNNHSNAERNGQNAEAHEAGDYGRTFAEEAAKASEQAMRVGLDVAQRAAEAARENIESAFRGFQRATEQLTQAAGPEAQALTRQSSENTGAVSQASSVLASGLQEASREWFGLARERLAKNIEAFGRLARCRSPQDLIVVQSDLARDNIQQAIETSRRVGQVSLRIAQDAAGILQTEARRNANTDRIRRAA
jgi:hypothetical protein